MFGSERGIFNYLLFWIKNLDKSWGMECMHGLSSKDIEEFSNLVLGVKYNDNKNRTEFPDYIGDSGLIELFKVTDSDYDKKGYDRVKLQNAQKKQFISTIKNEGIHGDIYGHVYSNPIGCIENMRSTFKKEWLKHIEALNKAKQLGKINGIACFLIHSDDTLVIDNFERIKALDDLELGSLTRGITFGKNNSWFPVYDEELLNFMYSFNDTINYVVYLKEFYDCMEVVKVANIPTIQNIFLGRNFNVSSERTNYSLSTRKGNNK